MLDADFTDATPLQKRRVERAVDLLNDRLPVKNRMLVGEPTTRRPQGSTERGRAPAAREVPDGDIHVSFRGLRGLRGVAHPYEEITRDPESGRDVYNSQWTRAWDDGPMPRSPLASSALTGTVDL